MRHTKRRRAHIPEQKVDVSINSLLDVLSVILVFLMKSYSATSVQVTPDKNLQVPFTTSRTPVEQSTAITVTAQAIMVDSRPVMMLERGQPKAGDANGMALLPLLTELQKEVDEQREVEKFNKAFKFEGAVTVISDRFVTGALLSQVLYTAGQAEFSKIKFASVKASD